MSHVVSNIDKKRYQKKDNKKIEQFVTIVHADLSTCYLHCMRT